MLSAPNALRWDGHGGHYEVYYVTLTDPGTGVGIWLRYTMVAPEPATGEVASCSLWLLTMDPRAGSRGCLARKATVYATDRLAATAEPFELRIGDSLLSDRGASGSFEDASWELRWEPSPSHYEHVHPLLRRARVAQTILVLPHADLEIDGWVKLGGERLELGGARGGQAHLWGSKHANRWAWVHCNEFTTLDGAPAPGAFVDAVSVFVSRFGREVGPNTPAVARIGDADFHSTSPVRVLSNPSTFGLTGWRFEAVGARRKLVCEVDADRELLAGVTYHDPDGELAYCYNGETVTMRVHVYDRARQVGGWAHRETLVSERRAHFEYAQRAPVPGIELLTT